MQIILSHNVINATILDKGSQIAKNAKTPLLDFQIANTVQILYMRILSVPNVWILFRNFLIVMNVKMICMHPRTAQLAKTQG